MLRSFLIVVSVLSGFVGPASCQSADELTEPLMTALRRLAAAQEEYWQRHARYAEAVTMLEFQSAPNVVLALAADSAGWVGVATRDDGAAECLLLYGTPLVGVPATRVPDPTHGAIRCEPRADLTPRERLADGLFRIHSEVARSGVLSEVNAHVAWADSLLAESGATQVFPTASLRTRLLHYEHARTGSAELEVLVGEAQEVMRSDDERSALARLIAAHVRLTDAERALALVLEELAPLEALDQRQVEALAGAWRGVAAGLIVRYRMLSNLFAMLEAG